MPTITLLTYLSGNYLKPKAERLTQALDKALDETVLVKSEVVRYPSFDDLAIPALLYKPKQASSTAKVPGLNLDPRWPWWCSPALATALLFSIWSIRVMQC